MIGRRQKSAFRSAPLLVALTVTVVGCSSGPPAKVTCEERSPSAVETAALRLEPLAGFSVPGKTRRATLLSTTLQRAGGPGLPAPGRDDPIAKLLSDPALRGVTFASTDDPSVQILLADGTVTSDRWCEVARAVGAAAPDAVLILQPAPDTAAVIEPPR